MNTLEQGTNNAPEQTPYSAIQHNVDDISLTSSEIGVLWNNYMAQSMSKCMVSYLVGKCKSPDMRSVLQLILDVSNRHVNSITEIFNKENFPIPHGFTDEDFDVNAERLFYKPISLILLGLFSVYLCTDLRQSNPPTLFQRRRVFGLL